jgi:hypothetical protein
MGIIAGPSFVTEQGFVLSNLYISVNFYRFLTTSDGRIQYVFGVQAFKSREDKLAGRQPIHLSTNLSTVEGFLYQIDFYRKSLQGLAYDAVKSRWASEGYVVEDIYEPSQPSSIEYIYNSQGYGIDGFNINGFNRAGFNAEGFNAAGYSVSGYNALGYNSQGFNSAGFNALGYNEAGYDIMGFNSDGWNPQGFGRDGYNQQALDIHGNPRPAMLPVSPQKPYTDLSGVSTIYMNLSVNVSTNQTDLSGSHHHFDISGMDLSGTDLSGTDLSGNHAS